MRLSDLASPSGDAELRRWQALVPTIEHRRRIDEARQIIDRWLESCSHPAVSVSGGKDSTALLMLVRDAHPTIPVYRADPPNPLPDRAEHIARLVTASGMPWRVVPYPWDVDAVLAGEVRYPAGLKVRRLVEAHWIDGIDGIALGIRAAESPTRAISLRVRGPLYRRGDGITICTPLAWWSAEQVIGYVLARDELPLNPVYRRTRMMPWSSLESLRDGTWWPHGQAGAVRPWLALHYPSVVANFDRALLIGSARHDEW